MYDSGNIVTWLEDNVEGMRRPRMKTPAAILRGAMRMQGTGVLALGRAIPFYSVTVEKGDGSGSQEGSMIEAEGEAPEALACICGDTVVPIIIDDRGFGNTRWLGDIQNRG